MTTTPADQSFAKAVGVEIGKTRIDYVAADASLRTELKAYVDQKVTSGGGTTGGATTTAPKVTYLDTFDTLDPAWSTGNGTPTVSGGAAAIPTGAWIYRALPAGSFTPGQQLTVEWTGTLTGDANVKIDQWASGQQVGPYLASATSPIVFTVESGVNDVVLNINSNSGTFTVSEVKVTDAGQVTTTTTGGTTGSTSTTTDSGVTAAELGTF